MHLSSAVGVAERVESSTPQIAGSAARVPDARAKGARACEWGVEDV